MVSRMDFKVLHHHRTGNEANILSEQLTNGVFLFSTSTGVIKAFHRLNSAVPLPRVRGSRQPPFLPLNGDASSSARIKSAAGDARAGKGLVLIKGVGGRVGVGVGCVCGGLCLVPLMLWMNSAPPRLLHESELKLKMAVKAIG